MLRGIPMLCAFKGLFLEHYVTSFPIGHCNYNKCFNLSETRQNLPKLPVPKLEDTLNKYLLSVKPLLNDAEFAKTINIVKDFEKGCGKVLQSLLEKRATVHINWLADWWLNAGYLQCRISMAVNSSPGLIFPPKRFNSKNDQLQYAARLLLGALKYKSLIDAHKISLDKMNKIPLDMAQYQKIFGICRIPCSKRDRLCFNSDSRHIVVIHNNHLFRLDVYGEDNKLLSQDQIIEQLQCVIYHSATRNETGIGTLTSEHRDVWANHYQYLSKDKTNRESLDDIEKGLVVLCLDSPVGLWNCDNDDYRKTVGGAQTLHGCGSASNGCNRWFDKMIQFIVGADGLTGLTYEHSPCDGQPVAFMADFLVNYLEQNNCTNASESTSPIPPKLLKFNMTAEVIGMITDAKSSLDRLVCDVDINCFKYRKYGKDFIKSQKLSPDSYIQMALQFAYYRMHKEPGAHYESASTRMFVGGRTEIIRSCSVDSVQFSRTMLNSGSSTEDKIAVLRRAVTSHKNYANQAMQGLGVDRHLLGLKFIAIENCMDLHDIFLDVAYFRSTHWKLSSSQVALKYDGFMCYGPVVADGYAICYNPRGNYVNFATVAFMEEPETDATKFRKALEESLRDMQKVLLKSSA